MNNIISFSDFINEELLEESHVALFENYAGSMQLLQSAIQNKLVCSIDYRGDVGHAKFGDVVPGIRIVEPYALGVNKSGNTVLRAWLIRGVSKTGRRNPKLVPGWRLFRIDRMRNVVMTLDKFTVPKKGYNSDDSGMTEVTFSATF